jgi:hypothetical protein
VAPCGTPTIRNPIFQEKKQMTRFKSLLAALVATAIVAVVPAASAATVAHVVGMGSSAQFLGTMLGADVLAVNTVGGSTTTCTYHWTFKSGINAHDNRDARILDETASNVGIVWIADKDAGTNCPTTNTAPISSGGTNITDVWIIGQYDSTLGVRLFSAQQKLGAGSGATIYLNESSGAGANLINPTSLYDDNASDVSLPSGLATYIGTASPGTLNVNMGMTDIRPEDALAATTRSKAALNSTTYAGLGYQGPTTQIGAPIYTAASGSTSNFTPIGFALSGGNDPINTGVPVPAYTSIPIGAAPIVFALNNGGTFNSNVANLNSGVNGEGLAGVAGHYYLSELFGGTGTNPCSENHLAFGGAGPATALTVILREPLSGTMNTTEYNVFRTTGNTSGSQETGVINPTRAPYNPLNLTCGSGSRQRRIGTGQVLSAINAGVNTIGYFFFSFANAATVVGSAANQANYQYFTVDGVDPLGLPNGAFGANTALQQLPFCSATNCTAANWTGSVTYPTIRNGQYKVWSVYRWTYYDTDAGDPLGPVGLAASIQNHINTSVADFVPFTNSAGDGLSVYRSHFTQSGHDCVYTGTIQPSEQECNGGQTPTETVTSVPGNSLGGPNADGNPEWGGDVGGTIFGWDYSTVTVAHGAAACLGKTKLTKAAGTNFGLGSRSLGFSGMEAGHTTGNPAALLTASLFVDGNAVTVSSCIAPSATILYVTGYTGTYTAGHVFSAYIAPSENSGVTDGALGKKN